MRIPASGYRGHRLQTEVISCAVCAYHRFSLSFRDIEDLLAGRGVIVSHESVRRWSRTSRAAVGILLFLVLLPASTSRAELLDRDTFTLDTVTRLEWLDLTPTLGVSYDDIIAGAGGFVDAGWRHATGAEVCALFGRYGIDDGDPSPLPGCPSMHIFSAPKNVNRIPRSVLDLLGTTEFQAAPGFQVILSSGGWFDDGSGTSAGNAFLSKISGGGFPPFDQYSVFPAGGTRNETRATRGHFLVRESSVPRPEPQPGDTIRVSVGSSGAEGNRFSFGATLSADGHFVAFTSESSNLVPNDTNGYADVFVHDLETRETTRISVSSDGAQGDTISTFPALSADGRFVAFSSSATTLVPGDGSPLRNQIYVHDRETGETTRVSGTPAGAAGNGDAFHSALSADGRLVAFASEASNVVAADGNSAEDVFVHDRATGRTRRVNLTDDGRETQERDSERPSISADGRFVAFSTAAANIASRDTSRLVDIFVHDRRAENTVRVSVASDGTPATFHSRHPSLGAGGRFVAFASAATNLAAGASTGSIDVFVHDRRTGTTTLASVPSSGRPFTEPNQNSFFPSVGANGRLVAFVSVATGLVPGDTNAGADIFVRDLDAGVTRQVSVASDGSQGNAGANTVYGPVISADGRAVVFGSNANNLVADDQNGARDIFVHYLDVDLPADDDRDGIADSVDNCLARFNPVQADFDADSSGDDCDADDDNDGMPDVFELANRGLNPLNASDAALDPDGDALSNLAEYRSGSDVNNADSDGDGNADGAEVAAGRNPTFNEGVVVIPIILLD